MATIRINELARELEVKRNVVLEYLESLGITELRSDLSPLKADIANRVGNILYLKS
jgi:hypothetical protein